MFTFVFLSRFFLYVFLSCHQKKNIVEIMKIDKAISVEISSLVTYMYVVWMNIRKEKKCFNHEITQCRNFYGFI